MKQGILRGSIILLIGFGVFNFLNLVYQFAMARLLSLSEISILSALFSLVYIFAIFSESIQTVVAKYTVSTENNDGKLKGLLIRFFRKSKRLGFLAIAIYLVIALFFYLFLDIHYSLLALNGILLYFMFLLPVTRGAMQGKKKFWALSKNLILESALKLLFSCLFVFLGFKIYGAIGGFILGTTIAYLASFYPLKKIYGSKEELMNVGGITKYARDNSFVIAAVILFYSADVIFARWLFAPDVAGTYAVASLLGKIILWASIPVTKAMFPLSAEATNSIENKKVLRSSIKVFLLLLFLCATMLSFSKQIITLFYGSELTGAIEVLPYLVIAFSTIAFSNMILLYQISKGTIDKLFTIVLLCLVLVECILFYFNNQDLVSFATSFVISSALLMVVALSSLVAKKRHI